MCVCAVCARTHSDCFYFLKFIFISVPLPFFAFRHLILEKTIHEICIRNVYQFRCDTILISYASVSYASCVAHSQLAVADEMNPSPLKCSAALPPLHDKLPSEFISDRNYITFCLRILLIAHTIVIQFGCDCVCVCCVRRQRMGCISITDGRWGGKRGQQREVDKYTFTESKLKANTHPCLASSSPLCHCVRCAVRSVCCCIECTPYNLPLTHCVVLCCAAALRPN